jgi:ABC-type glycerol-3-phosphate transport system substrate-binding protein
MDTSPPGHYKISRRSFLKRSLLGTGALALTQLPFDRSAYAATGPVTLTYWHGWTGEWEKMVQSVVEMYHAKQSKVRINPVVVPWDQFIPKLTAAIAAGNPPDVVTLFSTAAIPTLAAQQAIIALDDISGVNLAAAQEWFDPNILLLVSTSRKPMDCRIGPGTIASYTIKNISSQPVSIRGTVRKQSRNSTPSLKS